MAGLCACLVGIGLGRFAYTPLIPPLIEAHWFAPSDVLYLGAATTVLAYALFYAGLRTTPSSVASVLTLIEPLTATVLAVILLSEPLPLLTIVGGVLLLGAIAVLYLSPGGKTRVPMPEPVLPR